MILATATMAIFFAFSSHAEASHSVVGPRPAKKGDEKIIKSESMGYLQIFSPEKQIYSNLGDNFVWINQDYRIYPEGGEKGRRGYHRRPLELDAGDYLVKIIDDLHEAQFRVRVDAGRVTTVWLNDTDRPKFIPEVQSMLVRDPHGDFIGFRAN